MKQFTALLATALFSALLATAHPGPIAADSLELVGLDPRKVLNATTGTAGVRNNTDDAMDHIPIFKTANCNCPPALCDPRMNAKSICQCKAQALVACHLKSNGGCPKPNDKTCG
ncbi:unnamed protein product [Discula destructiva]